MTVDTPLHPWAEASAVRAVLLCGLLALACALPSKDPRCRVAAECDPGLICDDGHCRARADGGDDAAALGSAGNPGGLDDAGPADEAEGEGRDGPANQEAGADEDAAAELDAVTPTDAGDMATGNPSVLPTMHYFELSGDGLLLSNTAVIATAGWLAPPPTAPVKLAEVIGPLPPIDDVEAQALGAEIDVMVRVGRTAQLATLRGGQWLPWSQVATDVAAMGMSTVETQLVACLVSSAGALLVGERHVSGGWNFDDVTDLVRPNGSDDQPSGFARLDCAGVGSRLELLVLDDRGRLWSATHKSEGWTRLTLIDQFLALVDVDVVNSAGELNVLGSSSTSQWHRVKLGDQWTPFADAEAVVMSELPGTVLSGSIASLYSAQVWMELTSLGEVWMTIRALPGQLQYWKHPSISLSPKTIVVAVTLP